MSKSFYGDKRFFPLGCQIEEARGRSPESFWLSGLLSQERRWYSYLDAATSCVVSIRISVEFDGTDGEKRAYVYWGVVIVPFLFFCLFVVRYANKFNRDFVIQHNMPVRKV